MQVGGVVISDVPHGGHGSPGERFMDMAHSGTDRLASTVRKYVARHVLPGGVAS